MTAETTALADVGPLRISAVRIRDRDGVELAWGLSRAERPMSAAVAAAEAIEHLVATGGTPDLFPMDRMLDAALVGPAGPEVYGDRLMTWLRDRGRGHLTACREYANWTEVGPSRAFLPRFLVDLGYWRTGEVPTALRSFVRYGNSTGWSVGSSPGEAYRRGLVEVLERDMVSRFMISVYRRRAYPCAYMDLIHAPVSVVETVSCAASWLGFDVSVLVLRNPGGLTVCLASVPDQTIPARIVGKGADPDPWVACERAIGELCQIYAVGRAGWLRFDDAGYGRRISRVAPGLSRAYDLRICRGELADVVVDWTPDPGSPTIREWQDLLMSRASWPLYGAFVELIPRRLYAASVYVPGAERFFLAGHGIEVAPTGLDVGLPAMRIMERG